MTESILFRGLSVFQLPSNMLFCSSLKNSSLDSPVDTSGTSISKLPFLSKILEKVMHDQLFFRLSTRLLSKVKASLLPKYFNIISAFITCCCLDCFRIVFFICSCLCSTLVNILNVLLLNNK